MLGQFGFGAGSLWLIPTISMAGAAVTNPTPVPFAGLQEGTVEFSGNIKELFGAYKFPLISLPGQKKVTGKAKFGVISSAAFNMFFGEPSGAGTFETGEIKVANQESGTVPHTSTFIIQVTNYATFTTDLGVLYGANGVTTGPYADGLPLVCSSSASAQGIYSVASGTYTFNTADKDMKMLLSYAYTSAAAPGAKLTINNHLLGQGVFFKAVLSMIVGGKYMTMTLNRCISNKLTMGSKLEDFLIPEFDFGAMLDDSSVLGTISFNN